MDETGLDDLGTLVIYGALTVTIGLAILASLFWIIWS